MDARRDEGHSASKMKDLVLQPKGLTLKGVDPGWEGPLQAQGWPQRGQMYKANIIGQCLLTLGLCDSCSLSYFL